MNQNNFNNMMGNFDNNMIQLNTQNNINQMMNMMIEMKNNIQMIMNMMSQMMNNCQMMINMMTQNMNINNNGINNNMNNMGMEMNNNMIGNMNNLNKMSEMFTNINNTFNASIAHYDPFEGRLDKRINIGFDKAGEPKVMLACPINATISELLDGYFKKAVISNEKRKDIYFVFNSQRLSQKDVRQLDEVGFINGSRILVIDKINVRGGRE